MVRVFLDRANRENYWTDLAEIFYCYTWQSAGQSAGHIIKRGYYIEVIIEVIIEIIIEVIILKLLLSIIIDDIELLNF